MTGLAVGVSETAMDLSSMTPASTVPTATSVTPIGVREHQLDDTGPGGSQEAALDMDRRPLV